MERGGLLPAKVTMRQGKIIRVVSVHITTGRQARSIISSLQEGDQQYRRLVGRIRPTPKWPILKNIPNGFTAATDGTVKNGRGGAATALHSHCGNNGYVQTVVPVDGHDKRLSSYRTELFGLLAVLLVIEKILKKQGGSYEQLTGTVHCDNMGAVCTYNGLQGARPYSVGSATARDADAIQELRRVKNELPKGITSQWVKAHQRRPITLAGRLNNVVDRIAAEQHGVTGDWKLEKESRMLPATRAMIKIAGTPYNKKLDSSIQQEINKKEAEAKVMQALKITNATCDEIDWESIGDYNQTLTKHRRATRTKFVFRWTSTNSRKNKLNPNVPAVCPFCDRPETDTITQQSV